MKFRENPTPLRVRISKYSHLLRLSQNKFYYITIRYLEYESLFNYICFCFAYLFLVSTCPARWGTLWGLWKRQILFICRFRSKIEFEPGKLETKIALLSNHNLLMASLRGRDFIFMRIQQKYWLSYFILYGLRIIRWTTLKKIFCQPNG